MRSLRQWWFERRWAPCVVCDGEGFIVEQEGVTDKGTKYAAGPLCGGCQGEGFVHR